MIAEKRHKRIEIKRKILSMDDIRKILAILNHETYKTDTYVSLKFSNDFEIEHTSPEILDSPEIKNNLLVEFSLHTTIYDDTKPSYSDRTECCIFFRFRNDEDGLLSSIHVESNDISLLNRYYMELESAVKAMKSQHFISHLNDLWLGLFAEFAIGIAFFVYFICLFAFMNHVEIGIILAFPLALFITIFATLFLKKLYPINEIILGDQYYYPPKKKKKAIVWLFITFIGAPIIELIISLIWMKG